MDLLRAENIHKYYQSGSGARRLILEDVNITVKITGSFTTLLAPVGAGKTTLLKIIAALEPMESGSVTLLDQQYSEPGNGIAYIPEKPASFPWLTVKENIELIQKINQGDTDPKNSADHFISLAGLSGYEDHRPANISRGFRFRITLARALALSPKLILLDDCFKSMDEETRNEIYELILKINRELNITFLLGSTNINEALILSDQIFLMRNNPGRIFTSLELKESKNPDANSARRTEIEKLFRSENVLNTLNFSI